MTTAPTPAPEPATVVWRGAIPVYRDNPIAGLFWPFAKGKQLVESLYDAVVHSVWDELVHGNRDRDSAASVVGLALIAFFAVGLFQMRVYEDAVIVVLIAIWLFDRWLAQGGFESPAARRQIAISTHGRVLSWRSVTAGSGVQCEEFPPQDISCVCLERIEVSLGAFRHKVGARWRGSLVLANGEALALFEEADATKGWKKLKQAADKFRTRVQVADSLGENGVASDQSFNRARYSLQRVTSFEVEVGTRGARIVKKIGINRFSTLLGKVLIAGGLPFFMLLSYFMMIRLGALLSALMANYLPIAYEQVVINLSPSGIVGFFVPDIGDPLRIVEFLGVLAYLAYNAWKVSQPLVMDVSQASIEILAGKQPVGRLQTQGLEDIVMVDTENPSLLMIASSGQTLEISGLESREEYLHMLAALKNVTAQLVDNVAAESNSKAQEAA